jgi:uncharacterized protein (DUF2267 family)
MTSEDLLHHVAAHAGVTVEQSALRAVLATLGDYVAPPHRLAIADELPAELRGAWLSPGDRAAPLEERVLAAGQPVSHAHELIASVCCVLAEELSTDALGWLRAAVPAELARLLTDPDREATHDAFVPGLDATLARGRPGSRHPIADVGVDRAQSESVAAANPHGATKLSSSPGTTQDRRHETLAEAHGDPARTLARGRE